MDKIFCVTILLLSIFGSNALPALEGAVSTGGTPKITYSKKMESAPTKDVTMDCGVEGVDLTGVTTFNIMWTKYDEATKRSILPISSGTTVLVFPDKFDIFHPKGSYQYTLKIKNVKAEDSGTYRCIVDFGEGQTINADVPLLVNVPAHFTDDGVKTVTVAEGDAISIDCQPLGSPVPQVFWEKIGGKLPHYGGDVFEANQLDLPLIDRTHGGNYRCMANNGLGQTATSEIIIDVEYTPSVALDNTLVIASVYEKVQFTCYAQGNPIPEVIWMRDNVPLLNSANVRIASKYDGEDNTVSSVLTLTQAQAEDFGEYTCAPVNTQGTSEGRVRLQLASPPIITSSAERETVYISSENPKARSGIPVALECEAKAHPNPNYRWVKNGEPLIWQADPRLSLEEGTGTLLIENPVVSDNGVYQCYAYNNLGVAASDFIHLRNDTEITFNMTGHTNTEFTAEIGKPFVLRCPSAKGDPTPELTWAKAYDVADGLKIEFISSRRVVVDPTGNLWFTTITAEDDTFQNNFNYLCLASSDLHPEDLSLAKTVSLKTTAAQDPKYDVTADNVNVESFLLYSSPSEVIFDSPKENRIWCIFGGDPSPRVTWLRLDGGEIDTKRLATENSGQTLVFKDTRPTDAGEYQCTATNDIGEVKQKGISVTTTLPPKFTKKMNEQSQVVHEGTTVTFVCGIHGNDAKEYDWYFNTQPLTVATGSKRQLDRNKLIIHAASMADIGNYACKASNDYGYGFGQAVLNVIPFESGAGYGSASQGTIKNLREDVEGLRVEVQELKSLIEQVVTSSSTNAAILTSIQKIENDLKVRETQLAAVAPLIEQTPSELEVQMQHTEGSLADISPEIEAETKPEVSQETAGKKSRQDKIL